MLQDSGFTHGWRRSRPGITDPYKQCGEGFTEPTAYVRPPLPVRLDAGPIVEPWSYIYNWPVQESSRIASGRFCPCE